MSKTHTTQAFYSIDEAAELVSRSRYAIKRANERGRFPNAFQKLDRNRTWQIPLVDLIAAGFLSDEFAPQSETETQQLPQTEITKSPAPYSPAGPVNHLAAKVLRTDSPSNNYQILLNVVSEQLQVIEILVSQIRALTGGD